MKFSLAPFLLCTLMMAVAVRGTACNGGVVKVFLGAEGVGKSFTAALYGCAARECSGRETCTTAIQLCCLADGTTTANVMDTVGWNLPGQYTLSFGAYQDLPVSGPVYALYLLLEAFEKHQISAVEFYRLEITQNIRDAATDILPLRVISQVLQCPIHRVLTQFRPAYDRQAPDEQAVEFNRHHAPSLSAPTCHIVLPHYWREIVVFSDDLHALNHRVNHQKARDLCAEKAEQESILRQSLEGHQSHDCTEEMVVHHEHFCMPMSGYCTSIPIKARVENADCSRRRNEHNHHVNQRNDALRQRQTIAQQRLAALSEELWHLRAANVAAPC
eukprot:gene14593-10433_t